jgi:thioredoxin 1
MRAAAFAPIAALAATLAFTLAAPTQAAHAADIANIANIANTAPAAGTAPARGATAPRAAGVETAGRWSFDRTVLRSEVPVLVEFWASWCIACRQLEEPLNVVAAEMGGRARVVRVNVTWSQAVAARYGVASLPAILVFSNGEVVSKTIGGAGVQDLEDMLSPLLPPPLRPLQIASR